jgi:hypothetical protein
LREEFTELGPMGRVWKQSIVAGAIADQVRPHLFFLVRKSVHDTLALSASRPEQRKESGAQPLPGFRGKGIVGSYPQGFHALQIIHRPCMCDLNERKVRIFLGDRKPGIAS